MIRENENTMNMSVIIINQSWLDGGQVGALGLGREGSAGQVGVGLRSSSG